MAGEEWVLDVHDLEQFWATTKELRAWIAAEPKRQQAADERAEAIIAAQQESMKAVTAALREVAAALRNLEIVTDAVAA